MKPPNTQRDWRIGASRSDSRRRLGRPPGRRAAARTMIPVIGVRSIVSTKRDGRPSFNGPDAPGVPVATMAIGKGRRLQRCGFRRPDSFSARSELARQIRILRREIAQEAISEPGPEAPGIYGKTDIRIKDSRRAVVASLPAARAIRDVGDRGMRTDFRLPFSS